MPVLIPEGVKDVLAFLALARSEAAEVVATVDALISDLIDPDDDVDRVEDVNLALVSAGNASRHLESVQRLYESLGTDAQVLDGDDGE